MTGLRLSKSVTADLPMMLRAWRFVRAAESISPKEIKRPLKALTTEKAWSASPRNHHHNLIRLDGQ